MSKALKIAGAIVGVVAIVASGGLAAVGIGAFSVLGISGAGLTLIATGLALGSSLLAPKPKAPTASPAATDRLFVSVDLRAGRAISLGGPTALATDCRDQEYTDGQTYLHRFVLGASHKIGGYVELWLDDKLAWTSAGGVQGEYVGYLTVTPINEGSAANAINISARMGSSRRYTGCAYLYLRFKLTGNNKKSESPFAQAIPSRMTAVGKGALVYDPRLDSTAGGSGTQRANDQTTWAWSDSAGRNPALQMLWYLLGWRIRNPVTSAWKLAVGKGIPPERIDLESFITAANLCDELVAKAAGGTEPRYRSDGVFSENDDPSLVLDNLKATMNAVLDDVDGKIRITVLHNDLGTPRRTLTTADVLGDYTWAQSPSLSDTFNVIRGSYTDPSNTSLYQQVDYPEVRIDSLDGIERIQTVNLPMVQSASQAQRLVKQRLQRQLYPGTFQAVFQATAWQYQKGDVVPFTFKPLGWTEKLFRIVDMKIQVDGMVAMTLREEHPDIYLWDASDAPAVQGAAPTTYDYQLNPFYLDIQAIASNVSGLLTNENHTVTANALGVVDSYAGASGNFDVFSGSTDVSSDFTLATKTGGNPQSLAVTYTGMGYSVTGGLDAGEPSATLDIVATGTGPFTGVTIEKRFSLGKSLAGADGTPAKLVRLTATAQTFKFDKNGAAIAQTITFAVSKQSTTAATKWSVIDKAGTVLANQLTATALAATGTFTRINDDTVTMSHTQFAAFASTADRTMFTLIATVTDGADYVDKVSVVKLQDGADGLDGTDGIPGAPGANGQTSYLHTAYADSADGSTNFTTGAPGSRKYLGVYVDFTVADSTNPALYAWSLIKGADGTNGTPGAPGADGQPTYVHIAYATNSTGTTGFHLSDPTGRTYIGFYVDQTLADSTNPALYAWSLIKGADGATGSPGAPGAPGTSPVVAVLSAYTVNIAANSDNSTKAGQFPKTATLTVKQGTTDVTASCSVTVTPSAGSISASYNSTTHVVSVIDPTTGEGYVQVDVTYAGNALPALKLQVTRSSDAPPPASQTSAGDDVSNASYFLSASYGAPAKTVLLKANASGVLNISAGGTYTVNEPSSGTNSSRVSIAMAYRPSSGGGWSYSAETQGSLSSWHFADDPSSGGVTLGATSIASLTPGAVYEVGPALRGSFGNSGGTFEGSFGVSQ